MGVLSRVFGRTLSSTQGCVQHPLSQSMFAAEISWLSHDKGTDLQGRCKKCLIDTCTVIDFHLVSSISRPIGVLQLNLPASPSSILRVFFSSLSLTPLYEANRTSVCPSLFVHCSFF